METQHTVTARKRHRCGDGFSSGCSGWIEPGEDYLRAVAFPGGEMNECGTRPYVLKVCACCGPTLNAVNTRRMQRRNRKSAEPRYGNTSLLAVAARGEVTPFVSSWSGTCSACGKVYRPGDWIIFSRECRAWTSEWLTWNSADGGNYYACCEPWWTDMT